MSLSGLPEYAMGTNAKKYKYHSIKRKRFFYHSKGDLHHSLVDYYTCKPLHEYVWRL